MSERGRQLDLTVAGLRENGKHIIWLISEERDILSDLMPEMDNLTEIIAQNYRMKDKSRSDRIYAYTGKNRWKRFLSAGYLADAYDAFDLSRDFGLPDGRENRKGKEGSRQDPASVYYLRDAHILDRDRNVLPHFISQFLRWASERQRERHYVILFLISPVCLIPQGFENEISVADIPTPDQREIMAYLSERYESMAASERRELQAGSEHRDFRAVSGRLESASVRGGYELTDTLSDEERLREIRHAAHDFRGLCMSEIRSVVNDLSAGYGNFLEKQGADNGEISRCRKALAGAVKRKAAQRDSTITILESEDAVVGMRRASDWLEENSRYLTEPETAARLGIDVPRGLLIAGLPGTGKTQLAKKAAWQFGHCHPGSPVPVPLVQFRMDNLLGGLVGDSEANFKRCRKRIESLAPCVVLIDEIEKTFDTGKDSSTNSVRMNLLTALLDWMQENKKPIFFFATCNRLSLPPELSRDVRFSMRFSAYFPTRKELEEIMVYHLRRSNDAAHADGKLFAVLPGKTEELYQRIAADFFDRIAKEDETRCCYTGANIEALIQKTNMALHREKQERARRVHGTVDEKPLYSEKDYGRCLLKTAMSDDAIPYGMSNTRDAVKYWIDAMDNRYTDVDTEIHERPLFAHADFDREKGEFREGTGREGDGYDQCLQRVMRAEIESYYQKNGNYSG
ncbi:MAG: AAA family ATPase [Lachnospiraceae bacterium]|nr:AAA family ATPase [Lachnospiraceae bacterium]